MRAWASGRERSRDRHGHNLGLTCDPISGLSQILCIARNAMGSVICRGDLGHAFIEWAQSDAGVEAFCKISENRHDLARLRFVKDDGLPALYIPDFLVRTADGIYLVETKAQEQVSHPNVQRKLKAATTWCERINALEPEQRGERHWHYALIGESLFHDWREKGARLGELLAFSRARASPTAQSQGGLAL